MNVEGSVGAVVFDFDGTLAKLNINFPRMRKAVVDLIDSYGVPVDGLRDMYVLEMVDAGMSLIAQKHPGQEHHFLRRANDVITDIEIAAATRGELIEGTREMLRELKKRSIKTGVITRNCQMAVVQVFPDIHEYCNPVITREFTRNVKPHPEHLLSALAFLNVLPQHAFMVGDHPMDIKIGKDAGTFTIGVLSGYSTSGDLLKAGADIILNRADEILGILG
ncbi:MAG: HAD family hydrolase [Deltaproteobacteria bacterium]|nr:HAD family hydrolase [Deltaproteobacteria bacterium]